MRFLRLLFVIAFCSYLGHPWNATHASSDSVPLTHKHFADSPESSSSSSRELTRIPLDTPSAAQENCHLRRLVYRGETTAVPFLDSSGASLKEAHSDSGAWDHDSLCHAPSALPPARQGVWPLLEFPVPTGDRLSQLSESNTGFKTNTDATEGFNSASEPDPPYVIADSETDVYVWPVKENEDDPPETWFRIVLEGWIHKDDVLLVGDVSQVPIVWPEKSDIREPTLSTTTSARLHVRSGPTTCNDVVAAIAGNSPIRYTILGHDNASPTWYQIRYSNALTGWVHGAYIQTYGDLSRLPDTWDPPLANKEGSGWASAYSGPGRTYAGSFDITDPSFNVPILGVDAVSPTWYWTSYHGWVREEDVTLHGDWSNVPDISMIELSLRETAWAGLNVRTGPGTDHHILATIPGASTARFLILKRSASKPAWWQISFTDTVVGWVSGAYVQTYGDTGDLQIAKPSHTQHEQESSDYRGTEDC